MTTDIAAAAWARAVSFIKHEEALRLDPYLDVAGNWTVGYGHRCGQGQHTISELEALALLMHDIKKAADVVPDVPWLTSGKWVALVSLAFSIGRGAFMASTMRRKLIAGDEQGAAAEFGRWVYVNDGRTMVTCTGLEGRRARERLMFERG